MPPQTQRPSAAREICLLRETPHVTLYRCSSRKARMCSPLSKPRALGKIHGRKIPGARRRSRQQQPSCRTMHATIRLRFATQPPNGKWGTAHPLQLPRSLQTNRSAAAPTMVWARSVRRTAPPHGANQAQPIVTAEQVPWLPLLLVSLSLMGSLSANLFLGWSYLDARQKYRDLVRKTADTFRRVTNAAA